MAGWWGALFGRAEEGGASGAREVEVVGPTPGDAPAAAAAALRALDALRADVRRAGSELPTLLSSQLRQIDDLLRTVITAVDEEDGSTEQQYLLGAVITDYLPTPLAAFLALGDEDRADTAEPTLQFARQLVLLEETIRDLLNQVRIGAVAELSTHGRFLADKFTAPELTLDGR
jgi:signal transduction histidine kinase